MRRRGSSFAVAGCVSLAVHAAVFVALPRYTVDGPGVPPPVADPAQEMTVVLVAEPQVEPDSAPEFEMGHEKGTGFASHEIADPLEAVAPEADADQAYLSLDPSGAGDSGSDAAVARAAGKGSTRGQPGGAPRPLATAMVAPPTAQSLTPFGLTPDAKLPRPIPKLPPDQAISVQSAQSKTEAGAEETARAVEAPPIVSPPTPRAAAQPDAIAVTTPPQPTVAPVASPATGGATTGGSQQPAADPARMSDSESDPFSRLGTATFRDGALHIRFGRKVKTRKPKLLLGGQVDLLTLQRAEIVLEIDIDKVGRVTSVDVVKSSGSNAIDQPTRLAVYDWWFEPKKSSAGEPVADRVQFTIAWR